MSKEERSAIAWLESAVADGLEWHRGKQLLRTLSLLLTLLLTLIRAPTLTLILSLIVIIAQL